MSACTIDSNPDVSGIGIRVNLYVTMLLLAVIPETKFTMPLLHSLISSAGISGLALLITALVQTAKGGLSLYHAIFIVHILYFTGILVAPSGNYKGNIQSHLRRAIVAFVMTYGSILLFTGYAFYIWARAPTFGMNSECNDQIQYIFFFKSVSATTPWLRKLWMAGLGITLGLLILVPISSFLCVWCFGSRSSGGGRAREASSKVSKPLAAVYGVVMLELYEKRNRALLTPGEDDFTFGQIFALVQIIAAFNEVLHFCLGGCSGEEEEEDDASVASQPQQPAAKSNLSKLLPWTREKGNRDHEADNVQPQNVQRSDADVTNV